LAGCRLQAVVADGVESGFASVGLITIADGFKFPVDELLLDVNAAVRLAGMEFGFAPGRLLTAANETAFNIAELLLILILLPE
jgi:hypothetical protein